MSKMINEFRYKFSVIMAVYNTEKYVGEAIESVINQTIGFKENIQLILIDDGSTDSSGEICKKYRDKYPDNIIYEKKVNGGAADARNAGRKYVEGEYLNFFDSDDIWDENAFEEVYKFFEKNRDVIDIVSCRLSFIETKSKIAHPLDYKYEKGNRIIDLTKEYNAIQAGNGNVFFKVKAIEKHMYDVTLPVAEDAFFIANILIRNPLYGVVGTAVYGYRKRDDETSLSDVYKNKREWFFDVPKQYYKMILKTISHMMGTVPKFIQYMIIYDIQWRISYGEYMQNSIESERNEYRKLIKSVLDNIDDDVILSAKDINQYRRLYLLDVKYDGIWDQSLNLKGDKLIYGKNAIFNFGAKSVMHLHAVRIKDNNIYVEGYIANSFMGKDVYTWLEDSYGNKYELELEDDTTKDVRGMIGEYIVNGRRFKVQAPVRNGMFVVFKTKFEGKTIQLRPRVRESTKFDEKRKKSYIFSDDYIITKYASKISIRSRNLLNIILSEVRYIKANISSKGWKKMLSNRIHALRMEYISKNGKINNRVACVSFRSDNGFIGNMKAVAEALDVPKITFYGMKPHNRKQQIEACKAIFRSKVVVVDDYNSYLRDFGKRKGQRVVQLWHACGAFKKFGSDVQQNHPAADKLYHEGYDIVTVSSDNIREIYANAFGIPADNVKALGCARTDLFFDEAHRRETLERILTAYPMLRNKQVILYAPTFRDYPGTSRQRFVPPFDTDVMSDILGEDQVLVICPHPIMTEPIIVNNYANILEMREFSTNDMMFAADLLITDYSSVIFEFALLNKPMAFFCSDFDKYDRDFYLDYEKDLPGPLLKAKEELYDYISEGKFLVEEKHDLFVKKYTESCDGNSCKRIVETIKEQLEK